MEVLSLSVIGGCLAVIVFLIVTDQDDDDDGPYAAG
jgi:hypothetical protein